MKRRLSMERLERREMLADVSFTVAVLDPVTHDLLPQVARAYRVEPAQRVEVAVYVQDLAWHAPERPGVYAAYVDLAWDASMLTVDQATLRTGPTFGAWSAAAIRPDSIRFAGGIGSVFAPLDGSPQLVCSFMATVSPGAVTGTLTPSSPATGWWGTYDTVRFGARTAATREFHDAVFTTQAPPVEASLWHNEGNPFDVDGDGVVTPLDSIAVSLALYQYGEGTLPATGDADGRQWDANGNGKLDQLDARAVELAAYARQIGPDTPNGRAMQRLADFVLTLGWDVPDVKVNPLN